MPYPDLPASGTPIAVVQRDYSDGNGAGGAQTVELGGLDVVHGSAATRVALLGNSLSVVPQQIVGGALVDLPVTAGAKTPGTVLGDAYALPGAFGQLDAPFSLWNLFLASAYDYSSVIDAGDLELWFFQNDPGYTDGDTFDIVYASLLTHFQAGAPVLLDQRSDTASSRVLSALSATRPLILPGQTGWLVTVVRGSGFTLPASPHLAYALQFSALG